MRVLIIIILCLALMPQRGLCAFKSANDAVPLKETWNPQPKDDDLTLPMPCGLSLALRAVEATSGALLHDKTFPMGLVNVGDQDRQIYERQFTGHVAGPFTLRDMPPKWSRILQKKNGSLAGPGWYFIGKYEVSRQQWQAVMGALNEDGDENSQLCPAKGASGGNLPIAGVSWFEVQNFLNKYNAWLIKNHPQSLPRFAQTNNIGFLRLPTEEEWEFAAKGGGHVPPEWWGDQDIFPLGAGKEFTDYAVINEKVARSSPLAIGQRAANPLGLHDTSGNVSEMVDSFFKMSVADMANGQVIRRRHGSAGGLTAKGGSFRSGEQAALPGAREEIPLFSASGPARQTDLGFRLVLSSVNIPGALRMATLQKEIETIKDKPGAQNKPLVSGDTPLEMMVALEKAATGDMKAAITRVRNALRDEAGAREAEDRKNLEQTFRSLLYQAETLRAFSFRYSAASQQLDKIRAMLGQSMTQENRAQARQLLASGEKDLRDYLQSLKMGANYYKSTLGFVYQKPQKELNQLFEQTRREYGSGTIFDGHMRQNLDKLAEHIARAKKKGLDDLDTRAILQGLLPEKQFKILHI